MSTRLIRWIATVMVALLVLAASALLVSYSRWLRQIADGNQALAAGDIPTARQTYQAATQRLDQVAFLRQVGGPGYHELIFNYARVLYAAKDDAELTRLLENEAARAPGLSDESEFHFWTGNVQFRRALTLKDKQALQANLQQSAESFRLALVAAPNDWDVKYNYELTLRLLESMRKGKEDSLERIKKGQMKLLRENVDKTKEQKSKIAPEKRG